MFFLVCLTGWLGDLFVCLRVVFFNFWRLYSDNNKAALGVFHSVSKYLILFSRNATGGPAPTHPSSQVELWRPGIWQDENGGGVWLSPPCAPCPAPVHRHQMSPQHTAHSTHTSPGSKCHALPSKLFLPERMAVFSRKRQDAQELWTFPGQVHDSCVMENPPRPPPSKHTVSLFTHLPSPTLPL